MDKYFECFNCKELMGTVYESKCCGVLYCQNCKVKLSNTQCIKCNKLLELQKNAFVQRLLKNINVKCKYNCGITLPYDKMRQHLLTCEKKIYICSFDKISNDDPNKSPYKGNKKDILDHLVKEHSSLLLIFMENHQSFEPVLKKIIKRNNSNDINKEDTILDLTNDININLDFLNSENEENTSIEFRQDIQLLNGINNLNLINSNIQNFNDLQLNERRNNLNHNINYEHLNRNDNSNSSINLNNRINSLNSGNSDNDNNLENINVNNNINLLDVDLSRNHYYQPLRDIGFSSIANDNQNDNSDLEYRFNINGNLNSNNNNNNSEHNINNINNINGHVSSPINRLRQGNLLNNNNHNNFIDINSNEINNGGNNININNSNQHQNIFE